MQIAGREVEVRRRPYKRSFSLTLNVNGRVFVSAPLSISLAKVREFVISQQNWIESRSREYEILRANFPRKTYREGEIFPFLGQSLQLRFAPGGRWLAERAAGDLLVSVPARDENFDPAAFEFEEVAQTVAEFFEREGRQVLSESVSRFSSQMGLRPTSLMFRSQKTRWGSCTARGEISLNWRLIVAPIEVVDYVVIHELAHLRYPDHSERFWKLVRSYSPNYESHRRWLTERQYEADFLAKRSELHD